MTNTRRLGFLRNYGFSLLLIGSIAAGCVIGILWKSDIQPALKWLGWQGPDGNGPGVSILRPLGQVLLNLLFTAVVPLVFFSIAAAVAGMSSAAKLGQILGIMLVVFLATAIVSCLLMLAGVLTWPVGVQIVLEKPPEVTGDSGGIVELLTAGDFVQLLSRRNMMALIVFSVLVGLGASSAGEQAEPFVRLLRSGSAVMMRVVQYIMLYAPIGLAAYFADFVGTHGSELLGGYARAMALYYPICLGYAAAGFTLYAYVAGGTGGVKRFWSNIIPAMTTALATGSSVATIPTNLAAADRIGTPREVSEIVIPIGATVHMDGSCMAALLKIAFLYALFGKSFTGFQTLAFAVQVSIITGMVTSGVPVGGFVGEAFLVAVYTGEFPQAAAALPLLQTIGVLVDPPATMVNSIGDNVASMLVARFIGGKKASTAPGAPDGEGTEGTGTRD